MLFGQHILSLYRSIPKAENRKNYCSRVFLYRGFAEGVCKNKNSALRKPAETQIIRLIRGIKNLHGWQAQPGRICSILPARHIPYFRTHKHVLCQVLSGTLQFRFFCCSRKRYQPRRKPAPGISDAMQALISTAELL